MVDSRDSTGASAVHREAVLGFLGGDLRNIPVETKLREIGLRMSERDVGLVDAIFKRAEIIAVPDVRAHIHHSFRVQLWIARERRGHTFTQIREDKPQILLRGVAPDFYFGIKTFVLRRLFNALSRAVIFPAVIETTNTIPFNPTDGKLRAAMSTAKADDIGRPARAAVKRKLFAHDFYGRRLSCFESF